MINWLYVDGLLYLDKLFQNDSFRILFLMILKIRKFILLFHSELVTWTFYFYLLFRVTNSKMLLFLFLQVSN